MNEPLHDIDKLFLDNIEGHIEYPSKKTWDDIEADLDKTSAAVYKKKYEKTKRAALILLALIAGILIYELVSVQQHRNNAAGKNSTNENATVQKGNDIIKPSSKQDEKSNVTTEIDTGQLSGKQDAGATVQSNKVGIETKETRNDKGIKPEKKISVSIPEENTPAGKGEAKHSKVIGNIPGPVLSITTDARLTDLKKNKKDLENKVRAGAQNPNRKKQNSLPEGNLLTKKGAVENKNNSSFPIIQGKINEGLTSLNEKNKTEQAISRISTEFVTPLNTFRINPLIIVPLVDISKSTAKQVTKSAGKTIKINPGKPGFYLSVFFSPNLAWSSLENDEPHRGGGSGNHIEDHDAIKKAEHSNLSYTGGLKLGYVLNKNLTIQSGLNYTSVSTNIDPKLIFADRDNNGDIRYRLDCSSGYSFLLPGNGQNPSRGDSLVVTDSRNSLAYTGVPLAIEYKFLSGKISLSATVGGQANILLRGKTTTVFGKGTSTETSASGNTQALKSIYFSALTGITGEFRLNKKLSVTVSPAGQFGLSSINKGASVKTRANYFSAGAGLKLRL